MGPDAPLLPPPLLLPLCRAARVFASTADANSTAASIDGTPSAPSPGTATPLLLPPPSNPPSPSNEANGPLLLPAAAAKGEANGDALIGDLAAAKGDPCCCCCWLPLKQRTPTGDAGCCCCCWVKLPGLPLLLLYDCATVDANGDAAVAAGGLPGPAAATLPVDPALLLAP
jgi:hypothetical protein